jgi:hypothetical protein
LLCDLFRFSPFFGCCEADEVQEIGWKLLPSDGKQESFIFETEAMPNPEPVYKLEDWQIECPAIVFVYASDNKSDQYNFMKMLSDFHFGVQSQYIVQANCSKQGQRRIGQ